MVMGKVKENANASKDDQELDLEQRHEVDPNDLTLPE